MALIGNDFEESSKPEKKPEQGSRKKLSHSDALRLAAETVVYIVKPLGPWCLMFSAVFAANFTAPIVARTRAAAWLVSSCPCARQSPTPIKQASRPTPQAVKQAIEASRPEPVAVPAAEEKVIPVRVKLTEPAEILGAK